MFLKKFHRAHKRGGRAWLACRKAGFTLSELVIVISVIGVLTAAVFTNFYEQRSHVNYNDNLVKTLDLIKTARNYASTSRAVWDESKGAGLESYIPTEGYGVYVEWSAERGESKLILFANTSTASPATANQYDTGGAIEDIIEETLIINQDVIFEAGALRGINITPFSSVGITGGVIIFKPPLAEVYIGTNAKPADAASTTPVPYDTLSMSFKRSGAPIGVLAESIVINKTAGFPELQGN